MAVETRVRTASSRKHTVSMRNLDKGIGWTIFRSYLNLKDATIAADIMREK